MTDEAANALREACRKMLDSWTFTCETAPYQQRAAIKAIRDAVKLADTVQQPQPKRKIDIYNLNQPALIIEAPTGLLYAGQVGGVACDHPWVEGFLQPLRNEPWMKALGHGFTCKLACCSRLDAVAVRAIELRWPELGATDKKLELDKDRAHMGTECWIPVLAKAPDGSMEKGWLMLPDNCD